jgi:hypothetical protein
MKLLGERDLEDHRNIKAVGDIYTGHEYFSSLA